MIIRKIASAIQRRLWSLFYKRPIEFTRFGIFFILFALGVGAAAINTGNNLLYLILGILLGLIVVSGILSDSSLWEIHSVWEPLQDLSAGQSSTWSVHLTKGRFPIALARMVTRWNNARVEPLLVWWLSSHQSARYEQTMTPQQRGWLSLVNARYSTVFPFGLFEKRHDHPRQEYWLVYPKTEVLPLRQLLEAAQTGLPMTAQQAGDGSVPFVLRDYRMGDPARRIHWKASVRTGRLWVMETEAESEPALTLRVARWPTEMTHEEQEDFISFLASWCKTSMDQGKAVGLRTPDQHFVPSSSREHLKSIMSYLALIDVSGTSSSRRRPGSSPLDPGLRRGDELDSVILWKRYRYG